MYLDEPTPAERRGALRALEDRAERLLSEHARVCRQIDALRRRSSADMAEGIEGAAARHKGGGTRRMAGPGGPA